MVPAPFLAQNGAKLNEPLDAGGVKYGVTKTSLGASLCVCLIPHLFILSSVTLL